MGRMIGWILVALVAVILLVLTFAPRVVHESPGTTTQRSAPAE